MSGKRQHFRDDWLILVVWQKENMAETQDEERPSPLEEQLVALLPRLLTHAKMLARSKLTAEELVQNTCLRALERLDQWQFTGRFDGWVVTIMESIWFNDLRKKRQRQEQELPEPELIAERGFESQTQAKLMLNMLQACHVVSDEDFSLLAKRHVYGYSYRELAEENRESIGTMSSRISRARLALETAVKKLDQEGAG